MTWWNDSVGYEVYIRSFADGNGDGVGDFAGLEERLDHLAWLGVDIVWVTPFYPSPQADFGYDVADYLDVDPQYGTLDDFDRFVATAKRLGLRVMIDLVPNHTSDQHPWFRAALADPAGPYRDYYLFRPPAPDGGPPNNWVSHFGGPAWTLDERSGEYYCHLFLAQQPDLNWANPAVREEFDRILSYWIERGIDGFRIDVAHSLMKHPSFADNPLLVSVGADASPGEAFAAFDHLHDHHQPTTNDIYRRWKALPRGDQIFLLGEVYLRHAQDSASYLYQDGLDHALFFALNRRPWDPVAFVDDVRSWMDASPEGWAWTIASHDESRPPTRFGGGDEGRRRALALWMGLAMLPGVPFLYQGEELGLEDGEVAPEDVRDPLGQAAYGEGRDPCRTPMPWEPGDHSGFTDSPTPWLRCAPRRPAETVAVQRRDPDSILHRYRRLLEVRRALGDARTGTVEWIASDPGVLAFVRNRTAVVANLTDQAHEIHHRGDWTVAYDTAAGEPDDRPLLIPPRRGRILTRP